MKRRMAMFVFVSLLLLPALSARRAEAQTQTGDVIVRILPGVEGLLQVFCHPLLLPAVCNIVEGIDGTVGEVFLLQPLLGLSVNQLITDLLQLLGVVVDAEPDYFLNVAGYSAPPGLTDTTPVSYPGTPVKVWHGYADQPAASIINLQKIQSEEGTGAGTVAVIDTGVDTTHPVLQSVLVTGHDFTHNRGGGEEKSDINPAPGDVTTGATPRDVGANGSTVQFAVAVVNGNGGTVFNEGKYSAFGHGTMVSGIIHLVAPAAKIMPLKAFGPDGQGKLSDVLRAIYYGTQNGANILNMSFDFQKKSTELGKASSYADSQGVVSVASVGNDGEEVTYYPAGLPTVVGIASTTTPTGGATPTLSSFSNYGQPPVWNGAPGEGIITIYPYGTYAAGWGTSFSAPLISGTVALMRGVSSNLNQQDAAQALTHADATGDSRLGYGVLDSYQAVMAWCQASGKC